MNSPATRPYTYIHLQGKGIFMHL